MRTEMTPETPEIYRFRFGPEVCMERAQDLVAYAILLAQQVHGEARVRLDCGYAADAGLRSLVVDARTKAGQTVALFFTEMLLKEFGMSAFSVERVPRNDGFRRGGLTRAAAWLANRGRVLVRRLRRRERPVHSPGRTP